MSVEPSKWTQPVPHRWVVGITAIVLGLILSIHLGWVGFHTALETWDDDAGLFRLAHCFYADSAGQTCSAGAPYPPLVPTLTSLHFQLVRGTGLHDALVSLWPFVVLLCVAAFVGMKQVGGTMAGLAAMAVTPVVVWSLHIRGKYYTEVPLAALVMAAVVAYCASNGFRKRLPSLLFGLLLGLGLLTKWSYAFFLGPMAAMVIVIALWRSVSHPKLRWLVPAVAGVIPMLVAGGAAGRIMYGLTLGFWLSFSLVVSLLWVIKTKPQWLNDGANAVLGHIGLCVALCVVVAGPWYWTYLPNMQEFLAANLAQKFHGDPVSGVYGWPFYPSVLLTRMMSTPLLVLFAMGGVLSFFGKAPPLVRWSLFSLLCGALVLGVLPYRAGRYLVAGLGLVIPVALWPLIRWPTLAKFLLPATLAVGLSHQISWIPFAVDGARIPHHWSILTLPEQDLMGNTKRGIYQAYRDLLRPRWRFLPLANPPIYNKPMSQRIAGFVAEDGAEGPHLTVIVDEVDRLNLNAMRTHQKAGRPPVTSRIIESTSDVEPAQLTAWRMRAAKPRDQPATASGPTKPRQLYVVVSHAPSFGPSRGQSRVLQQAGFDAVYRDGVVSGFEPVGVTIWKAR